MFLFVQKLILRGLMFCPCHPSLSPSGTSTHTHTHTHLRTYALGLHLVSGERTEVACIYFTDFVLFFGLLLQSLSPT